MDLNFSQIKCYKSVTNHIKKMLQKCNMLHEIKCYTKNDGNKLFTLSLLSNLINT